MTVSVLTRHGEGQPFGCYTLHECIGRGGMGEVYRATGPTGEVALKVLRSGESASAAEIRTFRREIEVALRLRHPSLLPIRDFGAHGSQLFFTMPLVRGGNLENRLNDGSLDLPSGVRILAGVARAMDHAHRHGVLHRDLKPANVLLGDQDEPLVADFGLARFVDSLSSQTVTGQVMGSVPYMSPEQASGQHKRMTGATDIWSLCVVLYELLAGQRPFRGTTQTEVMEQIQHQQPQRPSSLRPDVPPALEIICLHGLNKNPRRRYPTMAALATDLEHWVVASENGEGTTLKLPPPAEPLRPATRFWGLGALAGVILAVTLALVPIQKPAPEVPAEERFLRILAAAKPGRPVVLTQTALPLRWSRVVVGADAAKITHKAGKRLWVNTPSICLLELLPPDPKRGDYRLTVTLAQLDAEAISQTGLYVGRSSFAHAAGVGHALVQATTCEPEVEQGGQIGRVKPPPEARVVLAAQYYDVGKAEPVRKLASQFGGSLPVKAGPKFLSSYLRTFALEMRAGSVALLADGKALVVSRKKCETGFKYIAASSPEVKGQPLDLSPTGGAGLVLHRCGVSIHRVVYEPLPRP